MKTLIFTEGGTKSGYGHIARCSSLYEEMESRGIEVEFIINGDIGSVDLLKDQNLTNTNWLSVNYLTRHINKTDYCIIDSYLATEDLYHVISNQSKKSLFIDDNLRIKYPKGIVVNPSLNVDSFNYSADEEHLYLLGPKYVILRSPFIDIEKHVIHKEVREVLITMGGSDPRNLTFKILKNTCKQYPKIKFNVVIGNAFQPIDAIEKIKLSNIKLYYNIDAKAMKRLMLKSDFCITAAGQTIYELLATQTPFIPIKIIDNQSNNIKGLLKINPNQIIVNYDDERLVEKIEIEFNNLLNYNQRMKCIHSYRNQIDGKGRKRIVDAFLKG